MRNNLTRFKGEFCKLLIDIYARGQGQAQFLSEVDITRQCFYKYLDRYPNFRQAYAIALVRGEAYWYGKIEENLDNPNFNLKAAKFIMNHRFGINKNRRTRAEKWLKSKDVVKSFDCLLKQYKDDVVDLGELNDAVKLLLDVATLKERTELEQRVIELEESLKTGNE